MIKFNSINRYTKNSQSNNKMDSDQINTQKNKVK